MLAWVGWFQLFPNPKNERLPQPPEKANPQKGGQPQVKDGRTAKSTTRREAQPRKGKPENKNTLIIAKCVALNIFSGTFVFKSDTKLVPWMVKCALCACGQKHACSSFFFHRPGLACNASSQRCWQRRVCGRSCFEKSCVFEIAAAPP